MSLRSWAKELDTLTRLNWNQRQSPTDLDDSPDTLPNYSFDYTRGSKPGEPSWPEKHGKEKFGPSLIGKAWKAGLIVVAEVEGFPHPVAVMESKWGGPGILLIKTLEGFKVPARIWTRPDARGLTSSGLLIEGGENET